MEVVSFLADELEAGKLNLDRADVGAYAYVDPTHAVRHPERHEEVRQLVTAVLSGESHELFWSRENAHPVGSTHLQFSKPELAQKLTVARLEDARKSGAEVLVCEDPGTLFHLSRYAESYDFKILGLYELLAENVT